MRSRQLWQSIQRDLRVALNRHAGRTFTVMRWRHSLGVG
jgi:hypothetical protein